MNIAKCVLLLSSLCVPVAAQKVKAPSDGPDCSKGWPTGMTYAQLKNQGIFAAGDVDFARSKTVRIASQKTAPNLFHQVYDVKFALKSGKIIEAIAVTDASREECSMGDVTVFLVTKLSDK